MASTHTGLYWTGAVVKSLLVLFMLFDGSMKVIKHEKSIETSVKLGIPEVHIPILGLALVIFTILFVIPQVSHYGLLGITAYLGGATAVMLLAQKEGYNWWFPVMICAMCWVSQFLISPPMKSFLLNYKNQ